MGLAGAALVAPDILPPEPSFTVRAAFSEARISLLGPEGALPQAAFPPEDPAPEAPPPQRVPLALAEAAPLGDGMTLQTFALSVPSADTPTALELYLPAGSRFLGLDLRTGRPGVVYDELGLNGAELTDLDRWDPTLRRMLLERAHPDLVVLAYGTNDEGLGAPDREAYPARARALLQAIREASGAPVLVVGPLDRLGRARRQRLPLKAGAEWVIQTLKTTALAAGCAFWDARQAMGGYGSIQKWRRSGLAQKDLVHLTGPGYQKLGDLLADRLLAGVRAR
jgi:lysophospholipase L1-like esterase